MKDLDHELGLDDLSVICPRCENITVRGEIKARQAGTAHEKSDGYGKSQAKASR